MADLVTKVPETCERPVNPTGDATTVEGGPHLEVLDRMCNIPMVHSALEKTGSTYTYVKESSELLSWALNCVESGLQYASATAAPIASPIVKKFEGPINAVDQTLCKGLDLVESKVSSAKEQPQHIIDAAKAVLNSPRITPTLEKLTAAKDTATQQASTLKEAAVTKANELLNTQFGSLAVHGVDNTSAVVNRLLDQYFPTVVGEEDVVPAPISAEENKVLHTVQTVGQLSTKTARRVYHSISAQLKTIKKEDVSAYMSSVLSILHLTQLLGSEKQDSDKEAEKKDDEKEVQGKK